MFTLQCRGKKNLINRHIILDIDYEISILSAMLFEIFILIR